MKVEEIMNLVAEAVKDTDIEYLLMIRSKSENTSVTTGKCTAKALFTMLAHAASSDPAVKIAVEATSVYLQEQAERQMKKENPGVSMNGLGLHD